MEADTKTLKQLNGLRQQEKILRAQMIELARKRREIIIRLHDNGLTMDQIARIEGVKRQRIGYIISLRGR